MATAGEFDDAAEQNEVVVRTSRVHWVTLTGPLLFALVLALAAGFAAGALERPWNAAVAAAAALMWCVFGAPTVWRWSHGWHVLTTRRVLVYSGRRANCELDVPLATVVDIRVERSLARALVRAGDIHLDIDGEDESIVLYDVSAPGKFRRLIHTHMHPTGLPSGDD